MESKEPTALVERFIPALIHPLSPFRYESKRTHLVVQVLLPVIGLEPPAAAEAAEQGAEPQGAEAVEKNGDQGGGGGGQDVEHCLGSVYVCVCMIVRVEGGKHVEHCAIVRVCVCVCVVVGVGD